MRTIIAWLLLVAPALAQEGNDDYWAKYVATKSVQCAGEAVSLMKALGEANKKIDELQKQLADTKKGG